MINEKGPSNAVDRIHTAFHGYLEALCDEENITYSKDASITNLFKLLQNQHPTIRDFGSRRDEIKKILRSMANILDALNTIRNHASLAHPNEQILDENEAMLSIHIAKTFIQYLDKKITGEK